MPRYTVARVGQRRRWMFTLQDSQGAIAVAESNGVWMPERGCQLDGPELSHGGQQLCIADTSTTVDVHVQALHCPPGVVSSMLDG